MFGIILSFLIGVLMGFFLVAFGLAAKRGELIKDYSTMLKRNEYREKIIKALVAVISEKGINKSSYQKYLEGSHLDNLSKEDIYNLLMYEYKGE